MGSKPHRAAGGTRPGRAWIDRHLAPALLALAGAGLGAGALVRLAGHGDAAGAVWTATGALGAAYASWAVVEAVRRAQLGVDAIALLAITGALAVGESLAAAVVALMLVSGRSLEAWASSRAQRDLRLLLERAPRTARRHDRGELATVPVDEVEVGDLLMVGSGEIVPVDIELRPHATRLRSGDRLRLDIRGSWHYPRGPIRGQFPAWYESSKHGHCILHSGGACNSHLWLGWRPFTGRD